MEADRQGLRTWANYPIDWAILYVLLILVNEGNNEQTAGKETTR